jgi:xylose isomerase
MSKFKFSVGPWNVHSGADAYGPAVRDEIPFEEKIKTFKEMGFDAIQFHDDDAVPNMNDLSDAEIIEEAKKYDQVIVFSYNANVTPWQVEFINDIIKENKTFVISLKEHFKIMYH